MTLTAFTSDPRMRPRKRPREGPSAAGPACPSAKPHPHNPTAAHPPLRRLFASVPSPILSDKRYGNLLDPLLTNLLGLISKQFVLSWYAQICPLKENTKPFAGRVTQILIHLIREIERRLVALDPVRLILVDVPTVLNSHILDIHQARARVVYQRQRGTEADVTFDQVFARLRPHHGIRLTTAVIDSSNTSRVAPIPKYPAARALPSPTYLRLLVETVMEKVLPVEDWAPETERLIVREIIVNVVLAPLFSTLTQPATIYGLIGSALASHEIHPPPPPPVHPPLSLRGRILGILNSVVQVMLLLPSIYQSISNLPTLEHHQPGIFQPSLRLLSTLARSDQRPQVWQACWILSLLVKLFEGLLLRVFVHLFYTMIISPITLSHLLLKITHLLDQTNPTNPPTSSSPTPEELTDILTYQIIPSQLSVFLEPLGKEKVAREWLELVGEQSANVWLGVQVLEIAVGRVFPELVDWEDEDEEEEEVL